MGIIWHEPKYVCYTGHMESTQNLVSETLVELPNGAMADSVTGKIVHGQRLTPEQASQLANIRWEKYRQSIRDGIAAGAKVSDDFKGVQKIIEALTERAVDVDNRHGVAAAAKVLDLVLERTVDGRVSGEESVPGIEIKADAQSLAILRDALALASQLRADPVAPVTIIDAPAEE